MPCGWKTRDVALWLCKYVAGCLISKSKDKAPCQAEDDPGIMSAQEITRCSWECHAAHRIPSHLSQTYHTTEYTFFLFIGLCCHVPISGDCLLLYYLAGRGDKPAVADPHPNINSLLSLLSIAYNPSPPPLIESS
jgi:hypothetical protein